MFVNCKNNVSIKMRKSSQYHIAVLNVYVMFCKHLFLIKYQETNM